jgi:hypothetical protein
VLPGRGQASNDAQIMVQRPDVTALRCQIARPKPDWADRAVLTALARLLLACCAATDWSRRARCLWGARSLPGL